MYNIIKKRKEKNMARKSGSFSVKSSFGGKRAAGTKQLISALSGVNIRAPKINKASNRQRVIKNII